jgi:hypothetical protein
MLKYVIGAAAAIIAAYAIASWWGPYPAAALCIGIWLLIDSNQKSERHRELLEAMHEPECLACRGRKAGQ